MPYFHYAISDLPEWVHIYGLDTHQIGETQAMLAEKSLCGKSGWKFLAGHHPIYSNGRHGPDKNTAKHILPVIQKCGVQAYFAGHEHHQEHISAPVFHQFIQGAAAKLRPVKTKIYPTETGLKQEFAASELGFGIVHLTRARMKVTYFDANGEEIYRWQVDANSKD
jgi:tartrate-resistant acid phosphatase type 5